MRCIAWLIEPPRQDISDLYANYDVRIIFRDRQQVDAFRDNAREFHKYMNIWAEENFNPNDHFLAMTGNLTLVVMASLALAKSHPTSQLRFLRYDHGAGRYCEVSLDAMEVV